MKKYLVVPDYWKPSWGNRPVLGIVYADDVFDGERRAYDNGLLRMNFTFKPKLIEHQNTANRSNYRKPKDKRV